MSVRLLLPRDTAPASDYAAPPRVCTGFAALDAALGGGLPCGQVLEVSGAASSGKATLAFGACLSVLAEGKAAAWVDPSRRWSPVAALEAGLPLDRLVVIHPRDGMAALKAAHLLLSCPGAVAALVVALPPGFAPADSNLLKLQRLAAQSHAALLFVTERPPGAPSLGPSVALRLCVRRRVRGGQASYEVEVARSKRGPTRIAVEELARGPDRLRVRSTL